MPRKSSREKIKALIRNLKQSSLCADCSQNIPGEMTFDHLIGEVKRFDLARSPKYSITLVMSELSKCQIVCVPCHRTREDLRLQDPCYQETKKSLETIAKVFQIFAVLSGNDAAYREYRDISREKDKKKKDRARYRSNKRKHAEPIEEVVMPNPEPLLLEVDISKSEVQI